MSFLPKGEPWRLGRINKLGVPVFLTDGWQIQLFRVSRENPLFLFPYLLLSIRSKSLESGIFPSYSGKVDLLLCSSLTKYSELHPSPLVRFKMHSFHFSLSEVCWNLVSIPNFHFLCGFVSFYSKIQWLILFYRRWGNSHYLSFLIFCFPVFTVFVFYQIICFKFYTRTVISTQLFSANFVFRSITHHQSFFLISVSFIPELMDIYSCGFHWVAFVFLKRNLWMFYYGLLYTWDICFLCIWSVWMMDTKATLISPQNFVVDMISSLKIGMMPFNTYIYFFSYFLH